MSTGANGLSYEDNFAAHLRLLAEVAQQREEVKQAEAARNAAQTELQQGIGVAPPAELQILQNELAQCDARMAEASKQLEEARTAVGALELAVGPEQGAWLDQQIKPQPAIAGRGEIAEALRKVADHVNDVISETKDKASDFAEVGFVVTRLLTAQLEQPDQHHFKTVIERPTPTPPLLPDLDQQLGNMARDALRQQTKEGLDEFERTKQANDLAQKQAEERARLENQIALVQAKFEGKHGELNAAQQAELKEQLDKQLALLRKELEKRHAIERESLKTRDDRDKSGR